jgi:hypothetical protein
LDYTERIKSGFTTNTGKPRLFCFLFQLKGKGSALSRGKSGMISILIDDLYFYPDTSDFISLNIVLDAFALPVKTNISARKV